MSSNPFDRFIAELDKPWPGNREVRCVFHGHSVPAGYFQTPVIDTFNSYPHLFHRAWKAKHSNGFINVIVTAIGGENSVQGSARFERDVLRLDPDILFLDYALNDRGIGLVKARESWTSMILAAKESGVSLVLLTPTPDLGAKLGDPQEPLTQHSDQIKELARIHGLALVDCYGQFCRLQAEGHKLENYMSQGNHPNRAGHEVVAQLLLEQIEP